MRAVDIIEKKRNGNKLTEEEIKFMVDGFTKGDTVMDYQMSAFNIRALSPKSSRRTFTTGAPFFL